MSSSFIEFRGSGFWSDDRLTESLVAEVADIAQARQGQDWLNKIGTHWKLQSSGAFAGWMHLRLDKFITDESRNIELQTIIAESIKGFPEDDPIHRTGDLLLQLLRGKVTWTASSPLDYMMGR